MINNHQALFHRDEEGKVCFSWQQAEATSDVIASMHLDELVKASLQKKHFQLPQSFKEYDEYYCNEGVYGTLNVLHVFGLVRPCRALSSGPIRLWMLGQIASSVSCKSWQSQSPFGSIGNGFIP